MADAAINLLVDSAKSLVTHYYHLLSGEKEQLQLLNEDLDLLKGLVADASVNKNTKSERFKVWLRQITDVVLDVEDTVACCGAQAEAERNSSNLFYKKVNTKKIDLAGEVKKLRENRVQRVLDESRRKLLLLPIANKLTTPGEIAKVKTIKKDPRLANVIPLVHEMDALVEGLTSEAEKCEVFSIVGMPGLGKTTLAWRIYHDPRIRKLFPTVLWVNISQEFNLENVLLTILEKTSQEFGKATTIGGSSKNIDELANMVRTRLQRGRFVLFLDDVWTIQAWKKIQEVLPIKKNKQGKILITTRNRKVAQHASTAPINYLRVLNEDESWELLQIEAYGNSDDCPSELEDIGKKIAKKCGGLPFAISVIGAVLSDICNTEETTRAVKKEWELVFKTVECYMFNDEDGDEEGLGQIVSLSYRSLSTELKDCFLYLPMFPEDTEIPVWKLTQLWIAEGFVNPKKGRSLEEIANDYVKELIDKNLLTVVQVRPDGKVKTVRVHDVILKFCEKESADLFKEIRVSDEGRFVPGAHELENCRRICIHSSLEKFLMEKPKILKARTFLSFSKETMVWKEKELPSMKEAFNVLRILDVNMAIKFPEFPNELTQLVLLKYVALSSDEFEFLPKEIYKLWNVQTLEVYTSSPTLSIKANIWKMKQLRHFKSNASIILRKRGKVGERGDNLHTINRLSPESCTVDVFSKAKNLKLLGIQGELNKLIDSESCLHKLDHLEKLKLVNGLSRKVTEQKPLRGIPSCKWFPKNIKVLVLEATYLDWEHMSTLGQLGTLEELKLKDNAFVGDLWDAGDSGFSCLESLHIADTDLVLWSASGKAFVNLKEVVLKNCKELKGIPDELVMRLELLHMERVGAIAVNTAKKLEKAIQKKQGKKGGFKLMIRT